MSGQLGGKKDFGDVSVWRSDLRVRMSVHAIDQSADGRLLANVNSSYERLELTPLPEM